MQYTASLPTQVRHSIAHLNNHQRTCDETYTCFVTTSLRAFLAANRITP